MLLRPLLDPLIERALHEDLAGGDFSAEACVDADRRATANALVKAATVVAGGAVFRRVFELLDVEVELEELVPDGTLAPKGTLIWRVTGRARSLLMGERTALNFVQRMSGTATLARRAVDALPPAANAHRRHAQDPPGCVAERYAVRAAARTTTATSRQRRDIRPTSCRRGIAVASERARARAPHTSRSRVGYEHDRSTRPSRPRRHRDALQLRRRRTARASSNAQAEPRIIIESSGNITSSASDAAEIAST